MEQKFPTLKYPNMEPPGGWVYKDLDTNVWLQSLKSLDDLVLQCTNHRRINKLEIQDKFAEFIESTICYRVDPTLVSGLSEDHDPSGEMISFFKANNRTTQFLSSWTNSGKKVVDDKISATRSALCVNCDFNAKHICLTCKGVDQWIHGWNHGKTPNDNRLGICKCDAVIIFASVHAEKPALIDKGVKAIYPEYCWKFAKE